MKKEIEEIIIRGKKLLFLDEEKIVEWENEVLTSAISTHGCSIYKIALDVVEMELQNETSDVIYKVIGIHRHSGSSYELLRKIMKYYFPESRYSDIL